MDDEICRGYILHTMSDSLLDIYYREKIAKDLWDKLETKYMTEDATSKKFFVSHYNNFKMNDERLVMEQYNELERILNNFKLHDLNMDETIIVSFIIYKLPLAWMDFKRSLKH